MNPNITKAFVMSQMQAAIATHAKPENNHLPSVSIVSSTGALLITGTDALYALHEAIQFALKGAAK